MKNAPDLWRAGSSWNPTREISRLQRSIDRMFDDFLAPLPSFFGGNATEQPSLFAPACDIEETDTHYLVSFDLPGVPKEDVKIEVRDNQLVVSGEKKEEHREKKGNVINMERYQGSFLRTFSLPSSVDADKVEASYEDGVLRLAIPKTESAKPKQIPIKEGKGGVFQKLLGREREEKEVKAEKKSA